MLPMWDDRRSSSLLWAVELRLTRLPFQPHWPHLSWHKGYPKTKKEYTYYKTFNNTCGWIDLVCWYCFISGKYSFTLMALAELGSMTPYFITQF